MMEEWVSVGLQVWRCCALSPPHSFTHPDPDPVFDPVLSLSLTAQDRVMMAGKVKKVGGGNCKTQ